MIKENNEDKPPISEEDLWIETNYDGKFLKCKKNFEPKNWVINQMGNTIFSTKFN